MGYKEVLKFQENIAKTYKYKALPPIFRDEAVQFYKDNLPSEFSIEGDDMPLFSPEGLKLCSRYNRVVVGDYGAYVEILPEDIEHSNIRVKEGQEYRDFDPRYSNSKYSWLTTKDNSDIKVYFQKKEVDYADYVPGRYYISPYDCVMLNCLCKDSVSSVERSEIADWLKKQKVFSEKLLDYYVNLSHLHSNALRVSVDNNVFPGDTDRWFKLNEVCNVAGGLSFEQFTAVQYNLELINASDAELSGFVDYLQEDIKTAIRIGLEGLPFPYEMSNCSPETIRNLLRLPFEDLMSISRFSKLVAGCKCDEPCREVFTTDKMLRFGGSESLEKKILSANVLADLNRSPEQSFELVER